MNRLPGEYETQRATVMLFPYRCDVWRLECAPIRKTMVTLANIIAEHQKVVFGVMPEMYDTLCNEYSLSPNVDIIKIKYNDCWSRDTVSSVIVDDEKNFFASFRFNAYGDGLYQPWDDDNQLDEKFSGYFGYGLKPSPITLEGGNILSDGNGTLFAVKDAIVNDNRNPGYTEEQIEDCLKNATFSKNVVWIPRGLVYDETGGHIDNLMAFSDKHTVLLSWTDNRRSPQYDIIREAYRIISETVNEDGEHYTIMKVPLPPLYVRTEEDDEGIIYVPESLPRQTGDIVLETYINFALANGVVVVPQFGHKSKDEEALRVIGEAFPDRKIVPLCGREASLGGGGFHCLTKHIN